MPSPYSELCCIDSFKKGVGKKFFESCETFLKENNFEREIELKELDKELWLKSKNEKDSIESLLCLRCRVSKPIQEKVNALFFKYRSKYELDLLSMMVCVLDDSGELFLRIPQSQKDETLQYTTKPFSWENISTIPRNEIRPFGAEVIFTFNPSLSKIDTWASHQVKSNAELKAYFRSYGLLLISPWALIADSSSFRVKEAWLRCGSGDLSTNEIETLHRSYKINYKEAKREYKNKTGKVLGWAPNSEFLSSLTPPQKDLKNLELIDTAIRNYLVGKKTSDAFIEIEPVLDRDFIDENDRDSKEKQIELIYDSLRRYGQLILKETIDKDRSKWDKDPSRKLAWDLYGKGLGQREIASRCNHKQGWVSKLIQEKSLAENIAQEATVGLVSFNEFQCLRKDPEAIDRTTELLSSFLISIRSEGDLSLFRQIINEVLNK